MTANEILEGIDQWIHEQAKNEKRRGYLGASSAGADCLRALWYSWRFCGQETFNSRMLRLFRRGHREEAWFVEMLRGMGAEVWDVNPATGEQWEISDFAGHFRGHADGVARFPDGMVALLEFKTYNDKRFQ